MHTIDKDIRPTIIADDVEQLRIKNFTIGDNCFFCEHYISRNVTKATIKID